MTLSRVLLSLVLAAVLQPATPAAPAGTLYALITPESSLDVGCQAPCACPLISRATFGSFVLLPTGIDPLFTHYSVQNFIASFNNGPGAVAITGTGQYRIGGEFALVHQLTLDLAIEGRPSQHFDSGIQPVGAAFPRIQIAAAVNRFFCFDSLIDVDALPADLLPVPPPRPRPGMLQAASSNPFTSHIQLAITIEGTAPAELAILDVTGRLLDTLPVVPGSASGPSLAVWDGRSDDGRVAPAGVYWAVLRSAGGTDRLRLIKLR